MELKLNFYYFVILPSQTTFPIQCYWPDTSSLLLNQGSYLSVSYLHRVPLIQRLSDLPVFTVKTLMVSSKPDSVPKVLPAITTNT